MNTYQKLVGRRIAQIRNEQNMTVEDLAKLAGMLPKAIRKIESGLHSLLAREIVDLALVLDEVPLALIPNAQQNRQLVGIGEHFDLQQFILRLNTPVCAGLLCSYIEASTCEVRDIVWGLIENECGRASVTYQ